MSSGEQVLPKGGTPLPKGIFPGKKRGGALPPHWIPPASLTGMQGGSAGSLYLGSPRSVRHGEGTPPHLEGSPTEAASTWVMAKMAGMESRTITRGPPPGGQAIYRTAREELFPGAGGR